MTTPTYSEFYQLAWYSYGNYGSSNIYSFPSGWLKPTDTLGTNDYNESPAAGITPYTILNVAGFMEELTAYDEFDNPYSYTIGSVNSYYGMVNGIEFTIAYEPNTVDTNLPGTLVMSFRGTDSLSDILGADSSIEDGDEPSTFDTVRALANAIVNLVGSSGIDVFFTGHSLGGAYAQVASIETGKKAVTFEAPGIADEIGEDNGDYSNSIINVSNDWSAVTDHDLTMDHVGQNITLTLTTQKQNLITDLIYNANNDNTIEDLLLDDYLPLGNSATGWIFDSHTLENGNYLGLVNGLGTPDFNSNLTTETGRIFVAQDGVFDFALNNGAETFIGTDYSDLMIGLDDDDVITGNAGDDYIFGGANNDIIYAGVDVLDEGQTDNDIVYAGTGKDIVYGGIGNDVINLGTKEGLLDEQEQAFGGDGDDVVYGSIDGRNLLSGGAGNDILIGGEGSDTITGGIGNDRIVSNSGDTTIQGDDGNDTIRFDYTSGATVITEISGNSGSDNLVISLSSADLTAAVKNDLLTLNGWIHNNADATQSTGTGITLSNLGITVDTVESLSVYVDDWKQDLSVWPTGGVFYEFDSGGYYYEEYHSYHNNPTVVSVTGDVLDGTKDFGFIDNSYVSVVSGTFLSKNGGTVVMSSNGNFSYTPPASDYEGADSFEYTITDGFGISFTDKAYIEQTIVPEVIDNSFYSNGTGVIMAGDEENNIFNGTSGDDTYLGDYGNDYISGNNGSDYLYGEYGNDYIYGDQGSDYLDGGAGSDIISGGGCNDTIYGGLGDDELSGGEAGDIISGGDGDDEISGGIGSDILFGGEGEDTIYGGIGNDTIYGGEGKDIIGINTDDGENGEGNDIIYADKLDLLDNYDDEIYSGYGHDEVYGSNGNNIIDTGGGDDHVLGYAGDDNIITGNGADQVDAGTGDNTVNLGDGCDLIILSSATNGVTIDLSSSNDFTVNKGNGIETVYSAENIIGTYFDDELTADENGSILRALSGNNTLYGSNASDWLYGYGGENNFYGYGGDDVISFEHHGTTHGIIDAGSGDDSVTVGPMNGDVTVILGSGDDFVFQIPGVSSSIGMLSIDGGTGIDTIEFAGGKLDLSAQTVTRNGVETSVSITNIEKIIGSSFAEEIIGDAGDNTIHSSLDFAVTINNNGVYSYQILDIHEGDILNGRAGNDLLVGGSGNDTFIHNFEENIGSIDNYDGLSGSMMEPDSDNDTLEFNITSANYNSAFINDIDAYREFLATESHSQQYSFNTMDLEVKNIDSLRLFVDGTEVNLNPTAQEDNFSTQREGTITGNVLADNGNGVDYSYENLTTITTYAETVYSMNNALVTINSDGTFSYVGATGFSGEDSFNYKVIDEYGYETIGTAHVTVIEPAPVAVDDSFVTTEDTVVTGNVLADNGNGADNDPLNDTLSVVEETITTVNGGTVAILANGDFTFTPATGYIGTDSFYYTLSDGYGETDIGSVTVTINEANNAPVAVDDSFETDKNIVLTGNVLIDNGSGSDSDPDGDTLAVVAETIASTNGGTVTILANGDFTYTPASGYVGTDSFNYTLGDGNGGTDIGTVSIDVLQTIIEGTNSAEYIYDTTGDDIIYAYSGNDRIFLSGGNDTVYLGDGYDYIYGYAEGNTYINGGSNTDYLVYSQASSQMVNGISVDALNNTVDKGNGYVDTLFSVDTIYGSTYDDTMLVNGLTWAYGENGNDYINAYGSGGFANTHMKGGNGNDTLIGSVGSNFMYGDAGDDILSGGTMIDKLYGGSGDDTYILNRGDQNDTIYNTDSSSLNDRAVFGNDVSFDQLWFELYATDDLRVSIIGTYDTFTIDNWYVNDAAKVDYFESGDSYELTAGEVQTLVTAMASMTKPPIGQTELTAAEHTQLDTTLASVWDQAA